MEIAYILFTIYAVITAVASWIGWRNCVWASTRLHEAGELLKSIDGQIETDDEAFARVCNMTVEQYRIEKAKGRAMFCIGTEICAVAAALSAPFRLWR